MFFKNINIKYNKIYIKLLITIKFISIHKYLEIEIKYLFKNIKSISNQ